MPTRLISYKLNVPLVEFMHVVRTNDILYMHATCQVRVTVGDSGLSCCTCVNYFER